MATATSVKGNMQITINVPDDFSSRPRTEQINVALEEIQAKIVKEQHPGKQLAQFLKRQKPFKGKSEEMVNATRTIRESVGQNL